MGNFLVNQDDLTLDSKVIKTFSVGNQKGISYDELNFIIKNVVVSDTSCDRDREQIKGWDLEEYMAHPVLLSSHNAFSLTSQIGKCVNLRKSKGKLLADFQYFVGEGNLEADWAWKLALKKILAYSIGFKLKAEPIRQELTDAEFLAGTKPRLIFPKTLLLEISQVTIPANPAAVNSDGIKCESSNGMVIKELGEQIQKQGLLAAFISEVNANKKTLIQKAVEPLTEVKEDEEKDISIDMPLPEMPGIPCEELDACGKPKPKKDEVITELKVSEATFILTKENYEALVKSLETIQGKLALISDAVIEKEIKKEEAKEKQDKESYIQKLMTAAETLKKATS